MSLSFRKMHGLGNDFIILDARQQEINLSSDLIRLMSDRRRGAGCDQFVVIKPPKIISAIQRVAFPHAPTSKPSAL